MKVEKINPSVKMVTVFVCVLLLSFQYNIPVNVTVFCMSMGLILFCSDAKPAQIGRFLLPAMIAAFGLFMMGLYYAKGGSLRADELADVSAAPYIVRAAMSRNLHTALQLSTRLLAYAGLGILFVLTTDGEQFVRSLMHQCRLSPKFAYGILAAVHLMPNMVKELNSVKLAYRVRGIRVGNFSPQLFFTMLVNSIRWSEAIAMAMESKGFEGSAERTYAVVPRVHWYDFVFSVFCIAGVGAGLLFAFV